MISDDNTDYLNASYNQRVKHREHLVHSPIIYPSRFVKRELLTWSIMKLTKLHYTFSAVK